MSMATGWANGRLTAMIDLARAIENAVAGAFAERTAEGLGEAIIKRLEADGYVIRSAGGAPVLRFETIAGTPVQSTVRVEMDVPYPMTLWTEAVLALRPMHSDPEGYVRHIAGTIAHKMLATVRTQIEPRLVLGLAEEAKKIGKGDTDGH